MSITYLEAIREAQARALAEDPRVFIFGQDVGTFGGAFKATKNLIKEYPGRVLDATFRLPKPGAYRIRLWVNELYHGKGEEPAPVKEITI